VCGNFLLWWLYCRNRPVLCCREIDRVAATDDGRCSTRAACLLQASDGRPHKIIRQYCMNNRSNLQEGHPILCHCRALDSQVIHNATKSGSCCMTVCH
jgi:hypothetical protein